MYNAEKYVDRCLNSIFLQKYDSYEVIVIDDGSIDNGFLRCLFWKKKYPNLIVISQQHNGVCSARNNGLRHANGEYIVFVDIDDTIAVDYLTVLSDTILRYNSPDIIEFLMNYIEYKGSHFQQGTILKEGLYDKEYLENYFIPVHLDIKKDMSIFYTLFNTLRIVKHSLLIDNDIWFNENIKRWEDWLFAMEVFLCANEMVVLKRPLYNYYANSNNGLCKKYIHGTYKFIIEAYNTLESLVQEKYDMFSDFALIRKLEQFEICILEVFYNEDLDKIENSIIEILQSDYFQNLLLKDACNHKLSILKPYILSQRYKDGFLLLKKLYF